MLAATNGLPKLQVLELNYNSICDGQSVWTDWTRGPCHRS